MRTAQRSRRSSRRCSRELNYLHPDGVHLTTGPLYHSGPLAFADARPVSSATRSSSCAGSTPPAWLRLVGEHRVTNTFTAPTQLKRIVSLPDDELGRGRPVVDGDADRQRRPGARTRSRRR